MITPVYERVRRKEPEYSRMRRHCDVLDSLQHRFGAYSYAEALAARAFQYRATKKRKARDEV